MTGQPDNPMQELVASGLHRLAQPISSALWSVELAQEPSLAPLPHVAGEMRRAAGILHVLRSLIEASTSYPETRLENLNDLLSQVHQDIDPQLRQIGAECQPLEASAQISVKLNAQGFISSYRMLLEKILWLSISPAIVSESIAVDGDSFTLTLECDSPVIAAWTKADRDRLLQELDPFDVPGFDFSSQIAPEITQARAILASAGLDLTGSIHGSVLCFQVKGTHSIQ